MMPTMQAVALYEALVTVKEVINGLLCQPRFGGPDGIANAAGEVLNLLRDQVAEQAENAIAASATGQPGDKYDRLCWANAVLRREAEASEDADALIAFAQALSSLPIQGRIPA